MKRVELHDPDRLVYKGGGGPLMLAGLPFACFGAFFIYFGIGRIQVGDDGGWMAVIVGSLFALVGLGVLFGRSGLEVDLKSRTYRSWWGLLLPWRTRVGSLDDLDRVSLRVEERRSKSSTYNVFPVRLLGPERLRIQISESRQYEKSRQSATEISRMLRLPLEDSTSGTDVVRGFEHLDESLRQRVAREVRQTADPGSPPEQMLSTYEIDGKTIRFEIPPGKLQARQLLPLLPLCAFDLFIVFVFLLPAIDRGGFGPGGFESTIVVIVVLLFFFVVPFFVIFRQILVRARAAYSVDVSPERIRLVTKTPFSTRENEIQSEEIHDVELSGAVPSGRRSRMTLEPGSRPSIVVRGAEQTLAFGSQLPPDEKLWIRNVIEQVVSA